MSFTPLSVQVKKCEEFNHPDDCGDESRGPPGDPGEDGIDGCHYPPRLYLNALTDHLNYVDLTDYSDYVNIKSTESITFDEIDYENDWANILYPTLLGFRFGSTGEKHAVVTVITDSGNTMDINITFNVTDGVSTGVNSYVYSTHPVYSIDSGGTPVPGASRVAIDVYDVDDMDITTVHQSLASADMTPSVSSMAYLRTDDGYLFTGQRLRRWCSMPVENNEVHGDAIYLSSDVRVLSVDSEVFISSSMFTGYKSSPGTDKPFLLTDTQRNLQPDTVGNDAHGVELDGRTGVVGLAVSTDETHLFASNVGTKKVYKIQIGADATPTVPLPYTSYDTRTITSIGFEDIITEMGLDTFTPTSVIGDLKMGGLGVLGKKLYLSFINSCESLTFTDTLAASANLRLFVIEMDQADWGNKRLVLNFNLNYQRPWKYPAVTDPTGNVTNASRAASWRPWISIDDPNLNTDYGGIIGNMAMFLDSGTDIASDNVYTLATPLAKNIKFDQVGNMFVELEDMQGNWMWGYDPTPADATGVSLANTDFSTRACGDVIRCERTEYDWSADDEYPVSVNTQNLVSVVDIDAGDTSGSWRTPELTRWFNSDATDLNFPWSGAVATWQHALGTYIASDTNAGDSQIRRYLWWDEPELDNDNIWESLIGVSPQAELASNIVMSMAVSLPAYEVDENMIETIEY